MQSERPPVGDYEWVAVEGGYWEQYTDRPDGDLKDRIDERDRYLDESNKVVMAYNEQTELSVDTDISEQSYKATLAWREQLREMPVETPKTRHSLRSDEPAPAPLTLPDWEWPPIPDEIADDFPDYPPDI